MIISIKKIINFLESLYPLKNAYSWDKTGLEIGNINQEIKKILITLDLTNESLDLVIKKNIKFVIVHHPFFWENTLEENFIKFTYKKKIYEKILKNKIIIYALHTNFDSSEKGMGFFIMKKLGFEPEIYKSNHLNFAWKGQFKNNIQELKKIFQKKLNLNVFITNCDFQKKFTNFILLPGSGSIEEIQKNNFDSNDIIITSDVKWSEWLVINEKKINLIEISHKIENIFSESVANLLMKKFNFLEIIKFDNKINIKTL